MDYEKKYNEALDRARANYKADKEMGFLENCDMLELIFPELRESEDERIRKEIITMFKEERQTITDCITTEYDDTDDADKARLEWLNRAIAYLEKQGEKAAIPDELVRCYKEFGEKVGEDGRMVINAINAYKEQKEQKPAEWSEEDESELTAVIYCVSQAIKASKDENERNSLLSAKKWLQDKLSFRVKSLRPSWKPSEEQFEAVRYFVNKHQSEAWAATGQWKQFTALRGLLGDLLKLM